MSPLKTEKLLEQIRHAVREVEPGAEIILHGLRSRGDALSRSFRSFYAAPMTASKMNRKAKRRTTT